MQKLKKKDPTRTRSGKLKIKGFQVERLMEELEKANKPKEKQRIRNRIEQITKRNARSANV